MAWLPQFYQSTRYQKSRFSDGVWARTYLAGWTFRLYDQTTGLDEHTIQHNLE